MQSYIEQIPPHIRSSLLNVSYILFQFLAWCSTFTTLLLPLFNCSKSAHHITFYLRSALVDDNLIQSFPELESTYHTGCTCSVTGAIVQYITLLLMCSTTIHTILTGLRLSDKLVVLQSITLFSSEQYINPLYTISIEIKLILFTLVLYTFNIFLYGSQCFDVVRDTNDITQMNNTGYLYNIFCYIFLMLALGNILYQRSSDALQQPYNIVDNNINIDQYIPHTSTYIPPRSYASNALDTSTLIPTSQYTVQPRTNNTNNIMSSKQQSSAQQQQPQFPPFGQPTSSIQHQQEDV